MIALEETQVVASATILLSAQLFQTAGPLSHVEQSNPSGK